MLHNTHVIQLIPLVFISVDAYNFPLYVQTLPFTVQQLQPSLQLGIYIELVLHRDQHICSYIICLISEIFIVETLFCALLSRIEPLNMPAFVKFHQIALFVCMACCLNPPILSLHQESAFPREDLGPSLVCGQVSRWNPQWSLHGSLEFCQDFSQSGQFWNLIYGLAEDLPDVNFCTSYRRLVLTLGLMV